MVVVASSSWNKMDWMLLLLLPCPPSVGVWNIIVNRGMAYRNQRMMVRVDKWIDWRRCCSAGEAFYWSATSVRHHHHRWMDGAATKIKLQENDDSVRWPVVAFGCRLGLGTRWQNTIVITTSPKCLWMNCKSYMGRVSAVDIVSGDKKGSEKFILIFSNGVGTTGEDIPRKELWLK